MELLEPVRGEPLGDHHVPLVRQHQRIDRQHQRQRHARAAASRDHFAAVLAGLGIPGNADRQVDGFQRPFAHMGLPRVVEAVGKQGRGRTDQVAGADFGGVLLDANALDEVPFDVRRRDHSGALSPLEGTDRYGQLLEVVAGLDNALSRDDLVAQSEDADFLDRLGGAVSVLEDPHRIARRKDVEGRLRRRQRSRAE